MPMITAFIFAGLVNLTPVASAQGLNFPTAQPYYSHDVIRIGRTIRPRRISPRRTYNQTSGTVVEVVNGSIIVVRLLGGELQGVRILGTEAPIIQSQPGQMCYAREAQLVLANRLLGRQVQLERDYNYQYDSYRNWVRYVNIDGWDVGAWLISHGAAFADQEHIHRKRTQYTYHQFDALKAKRGLWQAACPYNDHPEQYFTVLPISRK